MLVGMPPLSGCKNCRKKHRKCIFKGENQSCVNCSETQNKCELDRAFRFKHVHSVSQRRGRDKKKRRVDFVYSAKQVWLSTPAIANFIVDDTIGSGSEEDEYSEPPDPEPNQPIVSTFDGCDSPTAFSSGLLETHFSDPQTREDEYTNLCPDSIINQIPDIQNTSLSSPPRVSLVRDQHNFIDAEHSSLSPQPSFLHLDMQETTSPHSSPSVHSTVNKNIPKPLRPVTSHFLSERQAVLLRHYIENLAPWADVCDMDRHFATIVPQMAMQSPVILNAIFAFSSQNLLLLSGGDLSESSLYYSKSLSLLIPTLSETEDTFDENLLAAIVTLRLYEERDFIDPKCHLLGANKILNSIARFTSSGGLGEALSWVSLRQEIYVSLVFKQPLTIRLENFEKSTAFLKQKDDGWANVSVYLLAKVISYAFDPDRATTTEEWDDLASAIKEWKISKPSTFDPISIQEPDLEQGIVFPQMWLLSAVHVAGVQYNYLAAIVLQAYRPISPSAGFDSFLARKTVKKSVAKNIGIIIGLSLGNPNVQNAWFTTCHILSLCGYYLSCPKERQVAISFLQKMEKATGWRTYALATALKEQWGLLDQV